MRYLWVGSTLLALAWGALAFGAVYPWAYRPLLGGCAVAGLVGLTLRRPSPRSFPWSIATGLVLVSAAVGLQLVPVPRVVLQALFPATDAFLAQYELGYAAFASSHAVSIRPDATWRSLAFLVAFGLLLVGTGRALARRTLGPLVGGIAVLGLALALVGIVQRATYAGEIYGFWKPLSESATPFGPFVNRNHFAGWMLMALPLVIGRCGALVADAMKRVRPGWRARVLWLSSPEANAALLMAFGAGVMALALILTMSRSGMAALALALVLAVRWVRGAVSARAGRTFATGYIVALVVIATGWAGVDAIAARFGDGPDTSLAGRLGIWRDTLVIIGDFWLAGTGLNTFGVATLFYQTEPNIHYASAHNDYVQLAAEGGLLVCVPIVWLAVAFVRQVRRRLREDAAAGDEITQWTRMGAVIGLLAIAVQSLVDFSLQIPGNAALFAVLCGIALHRPAAQPRSSRGTRVAVRPPRHVPA